MKGDENPVCTTDFDLPTPPWGHDVWGDPGEPHPDEPGLGELPARPNSRATSESDRNGGDQAEAG